MIKTLRRLWKQWRCKHSGKWYVPVVTYAGPLPWGYCCQCGKRRNIDNEEWKGDKLTTNQRDMDFR